MTPAGRTKTRAQRLDDVIDFVIQEGSAVPQQLADTFGVSLMTIHRDLDELHRLGLVRKYYGGVTVERTTSFEIAAALRRRIATGVKRDLAERAVDLVEPESTIMLDDSTTVACMADRLSQLEDVRVWTNYLPLLSSLGPNRGITLNAIGGRYDRSHESFLGVAAVEAIRRLRIDTAFISATTADTSGFYHQEEDAVQLRAQMLRSARRRVLVIDSTKIDRISQFLIEGWDSIDDLVTDDLVPAPFLTAVRAQGVSVSLVRSSSADRQ